MNFIEKKLHEFEKYHQDKTNIIIHIICIPLILFSYTGILHSIAIYFDISFYMQMLGYFLLFSPGLTFYTLYSKMILFKIVFLCVPVFVLYFKLINLHNFQFFLSACTCIFIISWIGQIWGHKIEGRKPAFVDDLQFLLIGPVWVLKQIEKIILKK